MLKTDWRSVVTDETEKRIFEALEDPRWEWRTVGALSQASGLSHEEIRRILHKYLHLVRKSLVPSTSGDDLYTLQAKYLERTSLLRKGWDFLSGSSSSST